jgi:hypothetical protein
MIGLKLGGPPSRRYPSEAKGTNKEGRGKAAPTKFGGRSELPARVAQLVEQLICNQLVGGSSPFSGSVGDMDSLGKWASSQVANGNRL